MTVESTIDLLPRELIGYEVMKYLAPKDLKNCASVCTKWNGCVHMQKKDQKLKETILGPELWGQLREKILNPTPLPDRAREWLQETSPYWPNRRNYEVCHVVYIPEGMTLEKMQALMADKFGFRYSWVGFSKSEPIFSRALNEQWVGLTKRVVRNSLGVCYHTKTTLVERVIKNGKPEYRVPDHPVQVVAMLILRFLASGNQERLLSQDPSQYTCTQAEALDGHDTVCQIAVGGFNSMGIRIDGVTYHNSDEVDVGVLALRTFFPGTE